MLIPSRRFTYCLGIVVLLVCIELSLFHISLPGQPSTLIDIPAGHSIKQFSQDLQTMGYIRRAEILEGLLRLDARPIHAGEYQLTPGLSLWRLARDVKAGHVHQYSLTIPEGIQIKQLGVLMMQASQLRERHAALAYLTEQAAALEGQLLPETYFYPKGTRALAVIERAKDAMQTFLIGHWAHRTNPNLQTMQEALILASLVEKETADRQEMPLIAGVITHRLQKRMRLQVDPSVIYALGDAYTGKIRREDLSLAHPYNTYRTFGLPPGPIALPSRAAILAALSPSRTDALYYVSKGDGAHQFSTTLEHHQQAIQRYLRKGESHEPAHTVH